MAKTRKHRNTAGPLLTKHENTKHEKHVRGLQKGTADAPARVHALPCPSLMPFSHAPLSCPSLTHPSLMPFSLMPLSQKGTADALHSPMPLSHAPLSCHSLMPLSLTHMLSHHAHPLSHTLSPSLPLLLRGKEPRCQLPRSRGLDETIDDSDDDDGYVGWVDEMDMQRRRRSG